MTNLPEKKVKFVFYNSIRGRTLIIVLVMLACLTFFLVYNVKTILHRGITQLENQYIYEHMERVQYEIDNQINNVQVIVDDWAPWDDSYNFMEDRNKGYIDANLTRACLKNLDINLIMFVSTSGENFYSKYIDSEGKEKTVPDDLIQFLQKERLSNKNNTTFRQKGIINLREGPMIIASSPILTSNSQGPAHGNLIMGRLFNKKVVTDIRNKLKLDLTMHYLELHNPTKINNSIAKENQEYIELLSASKIAGHIIRGDVYGQPVISMDIIMNRDINSIGQTTSKALTLFLIIGCLIFIVILLVLLEKQVLSKLYMLSINIKEIGDDSDFSKRLDQGKQNDEISIVSMEVNIMLDKLNDAQNELKKTKDELEIRVLERTIELGQKNTDLEKEINEHKKTQEEIKHLAYHDPLTGLPNRLLFNDRLQQAILQTSRTETLLAILFLDLNAFKMINDTMGHDKGDELIKEVSNRLKSILRKGDTVARFGGDEFVILLQNVKDIDSVNKIAKNILHSFEQSYIISGMECYVTASIGIAIYPGDGEDVETLLKNSDLAMYKSKEKGRNKYQFCTPVMKTQITETMQITNKLYRAMENNELMVYYQPQISYSLNKIVGLEALLRWNNPELGFIPPSTVIPIAETTGLIIPIGEWVLQTACRQNKILLDSGLASVRMAVNLSMLQLQSPKIVEQVENALSKTGLPSSYLELEITESAFMMETDIILSTLNKFKDMGISISIDDFGTKYSSLNHLKKLPVDRLKIAMPFIHGISISKKDEAITKAIIIMAENIGLKVIAEGVETEGQLSFLTHRMCDEIQGYYYYKPMPADELIKVLRNGNIPSILFSRNSNPAPLAAAKSIASIGPVIRRQDKLPPRKRKIRTGRTFKISSLIGATTGAIKSILPNTASEVKKL